jgi:hypothetical protein
MRVHAPIVAHWHNFTFDYVSMICAKGGFSCGSMVLNVYGVFFFRPAGRKKNTQRVKIRGLRKSYMETTCNDPASYHRRPIPIHRAPGRGIRPQNMRRISRGAELGREDD